MMLLKMHQEKVSLTIFFRFLFYFLPCSTTGGADKGNVKWKELVTVPRGRGNEAEAAMPPPPSTTTTWKPSGYLVPDHRSPPV